VTTLGLSTGGEVFGMQTTLVNPPTAAARVPLAIVSFADCPGSRRCTCRSIKPGANDKAARIDFLHLDTGRQGGGRIGDVAIDHEQIGEFVSSVCRIDDAALPDAESAHGSVVSARTPAQR
jgi:hypothetical protein